jgi:SulP family sulfate permease
VIIKGIRPEHFTLLSNVGIFEALRHDNHVIDSLDDAIAHARSHLPAVALPSGST